MIESYVDLTYRGVSLGRRIKLTQVRPSSGYLELPTPMPVGTQLAIATDEGVTFDATVTWIFEQVAGADRMPGMVVRPRFASDPASAWWSERVALPDEDPLRVTRTRPVTGRQRSLSKPAPAASEPDRMPAIVADLGARVTAAAGVAPVSAPPAVEPAASAPATVEPAASAPPTVEPAASTPPTVEPVATSARAPVEPAPLSGTDAGATVAMHPVDLARLAQHSLESDLEPPEPGIRRTGEHDVVDDGYETMIMESVDPAAIGLDAEVTDPIGRAVTDPGRSEEIGETVADDAAATTELAAAGDPGVADAPTGDATDDAAATRKLAASDPAIAAAEARDASDASDSTDARADGEGPATPSPSEDTGGDDKPTRRGWFWRRNKRP